MLKLCICVRFRNLDATKQEENAVSVIERSIEGMMLGVSRFTQVKEGIRSFGLGQQSKIRDATAFAKTNKIRGARHVMRLNDESCTKVAADWIPRNMKRTTGRSPAQWSHFFTKSFNETYTMLFVFLERKQDTGASTARDRNEWKYYWGPLDPLEPTGLQVILVKLV